MNATQQSGSSVAPLLQLDKAPICGRTLLRQGNTNGAKLHWHEANPRPAVAVSGIYGFLARRPFDKGKACHLRKSRFLVKSTPSPCEIRISVKSHKVFCLN
jgi:hypothetical protein